MNPHPAESRPYGGVSSEERRARRRVQLLEAGLELFGTRGYSDSSIREVCLAASLNRRYFYESFRTREDLLRAVYDEIVAEMARRIFGAVRDVEDIEPKIRRHGRLLGHDDDRPAQGAHPDDRGDRRKRGVERHRREARRGFAEFVEAQALELAAAQGQTLRLDASLTARALVAATMDLVVDWMRGDLGYSVPELAEHCISLYTVASEAAFSRGPGGA